MDKETINYYGWIVVVLIAALVFMTMATPLGNFVGTSVKSSTLSAVLKSSLSKPKTERPDIKTFKITYDLVSEDVKWDGGTKAVSIGDCKYEDITSFELSVNLPKNLSKENYIFLGWSNTENGTAVGNLNNLKEDVTLYPVWEPEQYMIKYCCNGGYFKSGSEPKRFYTYNTVFKELPNGTTLKRDGYTFKGWYDNENFNGAEIKEIGKGNSQTIALYAKWEKK